MSFSVSVDCCCSLSCREGEPVVGQPVLRENSLMMRGRPSVARRLVRTICRAGSMSCTCACAWGWMYGQWSHNGTTSGSVLHGQMGCGAVIVACSRTGSSWKSRLFLCTACSTHASPAEAQQLCMCDRAAAAPKFAGGVLTVKCCSMAMQPIGMPLLSMPETSSPCAPSVCSTWSVKV